MIFLIRSCIGSSNPGFDIPLFLYAKFHISAHNNLQSKQFFRNEDWGHCSFLIFSNVYVVCFYHTSCSEITAILQIQISFGCLAIYSCILLIQIGKMSIFTVSRSLPSARKSL